MAASLGMSAFAHHGEKFFGDPKVVQSMHRAVGVHQVASIGFLVLAIKGASLLPFTMLTAATILFPGVVYYQNIALKGGKSMLASLVPKGGMLHMIFWLTMCFYFMPENKL